MEHIQDANDPRQHVNEEPRDDFFDTALGFAGMFGFMTLVFIIAIIVKFNIS